MSTADSQLLVTASAVSEDLYHSFVKKDADTEEILKVSRITVIVIAVIAFVIAWNPDSSIMGLVSNAWAGLGSAFGPIVVMSLFWRRTNLPAVSYTHLDVYRRQIHIHIAVHAQSSAEEYILLF